MQFYSPTQIKPQGWLLRQLQIQAEGLCGNLDKVWRDVRESKWIGGDCEGWERVPYWLDGFIPLAYLLNDADMIARAKRYVDAILLRQSPDGWICPCTEEQRKTYDTWPVHLIAKVLVTYYRCSHDERIPQVVHDVMKNYYRLLRDGEIVLFDWGKFRWFEGFVALNFLWQNTREPWIKDLARILDEQGFRYFDNMDLWKTPQNKWTFETHVVNLAMMLKISAVTAELLNGKYDGKAEEAYDMLMQYNGTPVGIFTGDECLSGLSAIQGTELCAVAELAYSCELLFAHTHDKKWADVLEKVVFNAMPATLSDDAWAHQYDQLSNQIACVRFPDKPIFRTNGPESHLFGLEVNYGCCTANFGQTFPKFAASAFVHDENVVTCVSPVPCKLQADGVEIEVQGEYPFGSKVRFSVAKGRAITLCLTVPNGVEKLLVNGKTYEKTNFVSLQIAQNTNYVFDVEYVRRPVLVPRPHSLASVQLGNLVFAVNVVPKKIKYEYVRDGVERKFPYCDYEYVGTSPWNYAFASDHFEVKERGVSDVPFAQDAPPVVIVADVVPIDWGYEPGYDNVAAKTPRSTTPVGEVQKIELIPYGCAKLRMTELPILKRTKK